MTLIEVLVAVLILSIAAAGTLSAFDAGRRSVGYSELHSIATQAAEREMQRVTSLPWEDIALNASYESTWGAPSSSTTNPTYYLSSAECDTLVTLPGTKKPCYAYNWESPSTKEPVVLATELELEAAEADRQLNPVTFTTSTPSHGTRLTVTVYRYVTWVYDPNCVGRTENTCSSTSASTNYKRITVAATVTGLKKPAVLSTLYVDPKGETNNALFDGAKCVEEGKAITEKGTKCPN